MVHYLYLCIIPLINFCHFYWYQSITSIEETNIFQAASNRIMNIQNSYSLDRNKKYSCKYHTWKVWKVIKRLHMESKFLVGNATIKQLQSLILLNTKEQYMKKSNSLAGNAPIKQLQSLLLLNTKEQYMKEWNILAIIVAIRRLQRVILINTEGQYMKESNSLAGNATIKLEYAKNMLSQKRKQVFIQN